MNIHEYQAKEILRKYGISIPPFEVVSDVSEVDAALQRLQLKEAVVKVQIHAGGRGKAGGVKFAKTPQEIKKHVADMLGMKIVNQQTGAHGIIAHQVMISASTEIQKEYYVGVVINREKGIPMVIVSPEGGMDIEEVAARTPERILAEPVEADGRVRPFRLRNIAKFMGWEGDLAKQGMKVVQGLARAFCDTDASLLEINPLVESKDGKIIAIDAKLSVDDNALFRQKQIADCFDPTQQTPNEVEAHNHELAYIALSGNIGCMVNGAGLAMATMDIIHYYGGAPANFLDVGGGADAAKVTTAFKIILGDPQVKAILVNIFGGIMNCATIAQGIIQAVGELKINVPLVVRLEGTNVEEGKLLLQKSGLNIIGANDLAEAAQKVVAATKEKK